MLIQFFFFSISLHLHVSLVSQKLLMGVCDSKDINCGAFEKKMLLTISPGDRHVSEQNQEF